MPRTKTAAIPPSKTSHLFATRKSGSQGAQTSSERIAADLAAFRKAGGRIEKLGNTPVLTRIDPGTSNTPRPVNPTGKRR
jgi:hypothetical protein